MKRYCAWKVLLISVMFASTYPAVAQIRFDPKVSTELSQKFKNELDEKCSSLEINLLKQKLSICGGAETLERLTDSTKPTIQEKKQISAYYEFLMPYRKRVCEGMSGIGRPDVDICYRLNLAIFQSLENLFQGKITYGQANTELRDAREKHKIETAERLRVYNENLKAQKDATDVTKRAEISRQQQIDLLRKQAEAADAQHAAQLMDQGLRMLAPPNSGITCFRAPGSPVTSCQ